jgi:hypothetical protein
MLVLLVVSVELTAMTFDQLYNEPKCLRIVHESITRKFSYLANEMALFSMIVIGRVVTLLLSIAFQREKDILV